MPGTVTYPVKSELTHYDGPDTINLSATKLRKIMEIAKIDPTLDSWSREDKAVELKTSENVDYLKNTLNVKRNGI